jgi:hypothetical protein
MQTHYYCVQDMEPELTCMATGHAVKKDWMTRQGTFGELVGGLSLRCSLMMVSYSTTCRFILHSVYTGNTVLKHIITLL